MSFDPAWLAENTYGHWLYRLTSPSGKKYYGITRNVITRFNGHKKSATAGSKRRLSVAIRKYGWENFKKEILCNGNLSVVKQLEKSAIATDRTMNPFGYNMTEGGDGVFGVRHTDEQKAKWSNSRKGMKSPDGTGAKISAALKGRKRPQEVGEKISAALVGRNYDAHALGNMSKGQLRRFSDPLKVIALRLAQKSGWTKEKREAQAERTRGRVWINNGVIAKQIPANDAAAFLELGWARGMLKH